MKTILILIILNISFYTYATQCPENLKIITNSSQGESVLIYLPELDSTVSCRLTANSNNINCIAPIRNLIRGRQAVINGCLYDCTDTCFISNETPVELLYFEVISKGTDIVLKWSTASELNNSHFILEKSYDLLQEWSSMTKITGNGTSSLRHDYQFVFPEHLIQDTGIVYFRLKQVDFDGNYEYSPVLSIELQSSLNLNQDIFDINGRKVKDFNQAPKGIYLKSDGKKLIKY